VQPRTRFGPLPVTRAIRGNRRSRSPCRKVKDGGRDVRALEAADAYIAEHPDDHIEEAGGVRRRVGFSAADDRPVVPPEGLG
jgi:hypothetical protein